MERRPFFLSPFVDVKPRNVHVPPYPPLSPGVKQPISPIPRVPVTKPTSSYRIDDILSKPDPRPPASMPTAVHYRSYPSVPPRRYGYGPNVSYLWNSMLQSQWRERFNGMSHVLVSCSSCTKSCSCQHYEVMPDNPHGYQWVKIIVYHNQL